MYCLPLDDACQWERVQYELIARPAKDYLINTFSFELGTFNGRIYTYVWDAKQPVIFIDEVDAPNARPTVLRGD
jgi:hypothetical protein